MAQDYGVRFQLTSSTNGCEARSDTGRRHAQATDFATITRYQRT